MIKHWVRDVSSSILANLMTPLIAAITGALGLLLLLAFPFFRENPQTFLLIVLIILVPIHIFKESSNKKKRNVLIIAMLEQLIQEILDIVVELAHYQSVAVRCSLWMEDGKGNLQCIKSCSSMRHDPRTRILLPLGQNGSIQASYLQKQQYFESTQGSVTRPLNDPPDQMLSVPASWRWRLTTPIFDAIDRLQVVGVLCMEGHEATTTSDIDNSRLDKFSASMAGQLCPAIGTLKRLQA